MVKEAATVVLDWHSEQNRCLRSTSSTPIWFKEQLGKGAYMKHVSEILGRLLDPKALLACGFELAPGVTAATAENDYLQSVVVIENELAEIFAAFTLALANDRIKRSLWFFVGWPRHLVRGLCFPPVTRRRWSRALRLTTRLC